MHVRILTLASISSSLHRLSKDCYVLSLNTVASVVLLQLMQAFVFCAEMQWSSSTMNSFLFAILYLKCKHQGQPNWVREKNLHLIESGVLYPVLPTALHYP